MNDAELNTSSNEKKLSMSRVMRTVFFLIASAMLVLFLSEIISGYGWNIGTLSGVALSLLIMGYTHFYDRINAAIIEHRQRSRVAKFAQNCAVFFAVLVVTYVITASVMMITFAHRKAPDSDRPPVVLVLGCLVVNDHPSSLLAERIKTAYKYLVANPDSPCIVSGGKGSNESISEAQCMYQELVRMGISPDRIYIEDRSTTTLENIRYSRDLIKAQPGRHKTALVTSNYHVYRAMRYARRVGLDAVGIGAHVAFYYWPSALIRECIAVHSEKKHLIIFLAGYLVLLVPALLISIFHL